MANEQEEIQKTLADLQKRAEEFQGGGSFSGGNYTSGASSFSPKIKLILVIVGLIIVFGLCAGVYLKTNVGGMKKPPDSVKNMPVNR